MTELVDVAKANSDVFVHSAAAVVVGSVMPYSLPKCGR